MKAIPDMPIPTTPVPTATQLIHASAVGAIGSYKIIDGVSVQAGIANRGNTFAGFPFNTGQGSVGLSSKDFIAALTLTAPDSWGWAKGSTLNAGTFQGFDNGAVNNYSVNATLATPVTGLKVGVAYDTAQNLTGNGLDQISIYGAYVTYQATDKLSFNGRGEYVDTDGHNIQEVTATVEYDLWANVVSRLEFRWDHTEHGVAYNNGGYAYDYEGYPPSDENAFLFALNLVYKF